MNFPTPVQPHEWPQVRVVQVAPVTDILKPEIKDQIIGLYTTLLSYFPLSLSTPTPDLKSFDSGAHGLKTISRLEVYSSGSPRRNHQIHALVAGYLDGTCFDGWPKREGERGVFELKQGTFIQQLLQGFFSGLN